MNAKNFYAPHVLAYNVNIFLENVLDNIHPHVDKIYIAHPVRPFAYIKTSRETLTNPTTLEYVKSLVKGRNIEIISGDWLTEEDMRNSCLEKAKEDGFDWFLIQDADEFYPDSSWEGIKAALSKKTNNVCYKTTWYNFWKSSQFAILDENGEIKGTNNGFAIRCVKENKFRKKREINTKQSVLDFPCYHYGYVMSDESMKEKISTWSHANDFFSKDWYEVKWMNWNLNTLNLHPTWPVSWRKAIRFPLEQPVFSIPYAFEYDDNQSSNFSKRLGNSMYDMKADFYNNRRRLKRFFI